MENEECIIPYFCFCDMPRKGFLILKIYINKSKFLNVNFDFNENHVVVSTTIYKCRRYYAKINFPVKILKPTMSSNYNNNYNHLKRCYELYLKKLECNEMNKLDFTNYCKIPTIDIISKHLSWNENDYQEEPELFYPAMNLKSAEVNIEDEMVANLRKQLVLNIDESEKNIRNINISSNVKSGVGMYGFAGRYSNDLLFLEGNWKNVIDLQNPFTTDIKTRHRLREENERKSFDVEHYLADYFLEKNDELHETVPLLFRRMLFKPYWHQINRADEKKLSSSEMRILANLQYKYFNLTKLEHIQVLHSLLDIILAYAYDYRINSGKHNSESAWNISKLSSTLSWFVVYENTEKVVISFLRRSLTYPLLRHWYFSLKVFEDALEIFHLGRRQLLNCLVSIFELFEADNDRGILNKLYINDYLIWIQQVHPETIANYLTFIESCKCIEKQDVFSILPNIEKEAIEVFKQEDEQTYNKWLQNKNNLIHIINDEYDHDNVLRSNDFEKININRL